MRIYRGIRDLLPSQINHRHVGDAVYGRATYYGLNEEVAERYATNSAKRFQAVVVADCLPQNPLRLSSQDIPNLKHLISDRSTEVTVEFNKKLKIKGKEIQPYQLCELATAAGYDSIIVTGEVEGGEQLIIPENSKLDVTLVSIDFCIWCSNHTLGEKVLEFLSTKFGVKLSRVSGWCSFNISLGQMEELNDFVDFYDSLSQTDILNVDFYKKTVEYYDED